MGHPIRVSILLALWASAASASGILEKKLAFPPPVQWKTPSIEISLVALAWGPVNSPEMSSKGRQNAAGKPESLGDRTYALVLGFRAKAPGWAARNGSDCSGLVRITNVEGDRENPWVLTPSGCLQLQTVGCGSFDVEFKENNPTEYWDLFPASPHQKEFLFEVYPPTGSVGPKMNPALSFRVIVKEHDFVITNASPAPQSECLDLTRNFSGSIGPDIKVNLQVTRKGSEVSGTHQYAKVGERLWLKGQADSLDNFVIEEQYPKNQATGLFKGKFSDGCRTMTGYFSKPNGARLRPFEFHEVENDQ